MRSPSSPPPSLSSPPPSPYWQKDKKITTIAGHLKRPQVKVSRVGTWWTKRQFTPERSQMCQVRRINSSNAIFTVVIEATLQTEMVLVFGSSLIRDSLFAIFLTVHDPPTFNLVFFFCNGHSGRQKDRQSIPIVPHIDIKNILHQIFVIFLPKYFCHPDL